MSAEPPTVRIGTGSTIRLGGDRWQQLAAAMPWRRYRRAVADELAQALAGEPFGLSATALTALVRRSKRDVLDALHHDPRFTLTGTGRGSRWRTVKREPKGTGQQAFGRDATATRDLTAISPGFDAPAASDEFARITVEAVVSNRRACAGTRPPVWPLWGVEVTKPLPPAGNVDDGLADEFGALLAEEPFSASASACHLPDSFFETPRSDSLVEFPAAATAAGGQGG